MAGFLVFVVCSAASAVNRRDFTLANADSAHRPTLKKSQFVVKSKLQSLLYLSSSFRSYSCTQLAVLSGESFVASRHRLV